MKTPDDLNEPTRAYSVRTRRLERRLRAGLVFGRQAVVVALTAAQAQLVQADAELLATPEALPELCLVDAEAEALAPHLVDTVDMGAALDVAAPRAAPSPARASKKRAEP